MPRPPPATRRPPTPPGTGPPPPRVADGSPPSRPSRGSVRRNWSKRRDRSRSPRGPSVDAVRVEQSRRRAGSPTVDQARVAVHEHHLGVVECDERRARCAAATTRRPRREHDDLVGPPRWPARSTGDAERDRVLDEGEPGWVGVRGEGCAHEFDRGILRCIVWTAASSTGSVCAKMLASCSATNRSPLCVTGRPRP